MVSLSQVREMMRKLDEQDVPREDRCFNYVDQNGHIQIINHNSIITFEQMRLMPEHIRALFVRGDLDGK